MLKSKGQIISLGINKKEKEIKDVNIQLETKIRELSG